MYSISKDVISEVTILTGDNDLLQCWEDGRVRIARSVRADGIKFIDEEYVLKKFNGVPVKKILLYRVLVGDASDNIPGVLKPSRAKAIVENYDDIDSMLTCEELEGMRELILRNKSLMELKRIPCLFYKQDNIAEVYEIANRFGLRSFVKWSEGVMSNGL